LILTYDALADGVTTDDVIRRVLTTMPMPQVTPRQESGLQDTA
jgi:MoxR-like ATPase